MSSFVKSLNLKLFVPILFVEAVRGLFIVLFAWLLQFGIRNAKFEIFLMLFIILVLRIFLENFRQKRIIFLSLSFQNSLRKNLNHLTFSDIKGSELLTLIFDTLSSFDDFFVKVLPNILSIITLLPLILLVTLFSDPATALLFLLTLPIAPLLLYLISNAIKLKNQSALQALNKLNFDFRELLASITTVKIFNKNKSLTAKLMDTSKNSAAKTLEVLKLTFVSAFVLELITTLSIAIIAVTIGLRLIDDSIDFSIALFLLILAPDFYFPIRQIGVAFHVVVRCRDSLTQLETFLGSDWSKWLRQDNFFKKHN